MSISLIVDVSNNYFSLKKYDKKLSYDSLVKFVSDVGTIKEMVAIVVHDKANNNQKFLTMLRHLGFKVLTSPNATAAQFDAIKVANSQLKDSNRVFLCTNAICPLYELSEHSDKIVVIGRDIPIDFSEKYKCVEIPPSLTI